MAKEVRKNSIFFDRLKQCMSGRFGVVSNNMWALCASEERFHFSYMCWSVWHNKNEILYGKRGRDMVEILE